ncbi:myb/SANT-like DNA-binding domain-containing protein 4 [Phlebotomus argentipes]|uniref:myb/SANT-like DNA-binding domain-containing protein 4 n=1 Tax=Phlebotomus argentipes TaxID=94469 RepID=UPI0028933D37|nr:myb/SANT-like DNA-binding domain-containing protein 4 [Phlebotomus argentipes]
MEHLYSKRDRTTIGQFAVLIQFMEENVAFAKQKARGNMYEDGVRETWKDLADQLNSRGPPVRDWKTWRKVWNDFKFETRKKIKLSKMHKTGRNGRVGLPQRSLELSENQRRVTKLLGLDPMESDNEQDAILLNPAEVKRSPSSMESSSKIEFVSMSNDNYENDEESSEDRAETPLMSSVRRMSVSAADITRSDSHIHEHLQVVMEQHARLQSMEERRLEVEERRLAVEEERLHIEQKRLAIEQQKLAYEKERFEREKARWNVEESNAKAADKSADQTKNCK